MITVSRWLPLLLCSSALMLHADALTLKVVDKEPPKELSQEIRQVLQTRAIQLLDGEMPVYEFWFRSEVPLKSAPEELRSHLKTLEPTTLLGAVAVRRDERDYRGDELYEGVYTIRFSLQPQDGNHLGTADYPYFAALIPAKLDTKPDFITSYDAMVKASSKESATGHPFILSFRPASTAEGDLPLLNEPVADHKSVRVKLPGKTPGAANTTSIVFELVYEGKPNV